MVNVERSGRRTGLEDGLLKRRYLNKVEKYPSHQALPSRSKIRFNYFFKTSLAANVF